jgi:DNA-binding transcriptional MerR regulator
MTQPLRKIGDVAETLGTTIRTIRYYEEEGLLTPVRTEGGTRLYSDRHIDRLRAILRLAQSGYSLEAIRDLARTREQCASGDQTAAAVASRLEGLLADIDKRMHELRSLALEVARRGTRCSSAAAARTRRAPPVARSAPSSTACPTSSC